MMREVTDLLATRTVVVDFAHGKSEYWLTDREFSVGQTLERDGRVWIVSDVAGSAQTGEKLRISVTEAETAKTRDAPASEDGSIVQPRPRVARMDDLSAHAARLA
jgi:hypothetical protein